MARRFSLDLSIGFTAAIVFWGWLFLGLTELSAQNAHVEDLKRQLQLHTEPDTFRINRLNELAELHAYVNADDQKKLSDEAIRLSQKLGYRSGEVTALVIGGRVPLYKGNRELSLRMFHRADSLARTLDDPLLSYKVAFNQSLGWSEFDNRKALRWALRADSQAHRLNDKYIISVAQFRVSELYTILNDYANAMEYVIRSLDNATLAGCEPCVAQRLGKIGNIYGEIGNYEMATDYYQQQWAAYDRIKAGNREYGWLYNNLGQTYDRLKHDFPKAVEYYKKAMATDTSHSRREVTLLNMASVYMDADSIEPAYRLAVEGRRLAQESDDFYLQALAEEVLSRIYLERNMIDSAIYFAGMGLKHAEAISNMDNISKNALVMANAYAAKNDFKNAFRFMKLSKEYRDTISGKEIKNKLSIIERENKLKESQNKIALLNQQKSSQQFFIVAISAILALVIVASVSFFRSNREKTRYSHERELLIQTVQAQEDERKRIAQDLHDELGAVLSIARMHIVQIQDEAGRVNLAEGLQQARLLTESALATMRRISYELMPQQLEEFGLIRTLQSIARQTNHATQINVDVIADSDSRRWSKAIERGLYRVCMELISNTIKHADARNIRIQVQQNSGEIVLDYSDDGRGLAENYTVGHGFRNAEARVNALGGAIRFGKNEGNGFHALLNIPA